MQNYFRTLYFTISSKTKAVPYAIPFLKGKGEKGVYIFLDYAE